MESCVKNKEKEERNNVMFKMVVKKTMCIQFEGQLGATMWLLGTEPGPLREQQVFFTLGHLSSPEIPEIVLI